jgi:hypothetical protein
MNRDLFLAILSMDSYNRGYGVGLKGLNETGQLGNATLLAATPAQKAGWEAAGFYAIAYNVSTAGISGLSGTVISYRGTDVIGGLPWTDSFWTGDLLNGYGLAVGSYVHPQAILARQFYQTVAGTAGGADPFAANITTTGHSLGGGLAGFVARLYRNKGVLFDNMTFELAASNAYDAALQNPSISGSIYGSITAQAPSNANLRAFATYGEFLAVNRAAGGQSHESEQRKGLVTTTVDANASGTELDRIRVWYSREASVGRDVLKDIDEVIINFGAGIGPQPTDADGIALQVAGDGGVSVTYAEGRHFLISGSGGAANDNSISISIRFAA